MDYYQQRRHFMVESQLRTNKVTNPQLLEAMGRIPREQFVGEALAELAYIDEDLMIDDGRFLLEPMVFARMAQALDLKPDDSVLDIGAASGYSSAVLSRLTQSVVGVEESTQLVAFGQHQLTHLDIDNAVLVEGSLSQGFPAEAPYQAIIIEGAVETVPKPLLDQLSPDGRLITVLKPSANVQGRAVKFIRAGADFAHTILFDANTPLLGAFTQPLTFKFGT